MTEQIAAAIEYFGLTPEEWSALVRDARKRATLEAYKRFLAADEIWSDNLRARFGKHAGDKRYLLEGRAVEGHDEFVQANNEWLHLVKANH